MLYTTFELKCRPKLFAANTLRVFGQALNTAIPFTCWRPLWNGTVCGAQFTGPPIGCGWAKPRAGLGQTGLRALGTRRPSKTFIFTPCIGDFANTCRAKALR